MRLADTGECVFCAIIDHRAPGTILEEDPVTTVFVPLNPVTEGHVLIVARNHTTCPEDDRVTDAIVQIAAAEWGRHSTEDYHLITNVGSDAGQTVPHLHRHFVPRRPGDGLRMLWDD